MLASTTWLSLSKELGHAETIYPVYSVLRRPCCCSLETLMHHLIDSRYVENILESVRDKWIKILISIVFLIQWTWRRLKELDFQPIWTRFIGHNCGRPSSKNRHKMTEANEWQNIAWAFNYLWGVKIVNGSKSNYIVGLWSKLYLFIQIWY